MQIKDAYDYLSLEINENLEKNVHFLVKEFLEKARNMSNAELNSNDDNVFILKSLNNCLATELFHIELKEEKSTNLFLESLSVPMFKKQSRKQSKAPNSNTEVKKVQSSNNITSKASRREYFEKFQSKTKENL